MEEAAYLNSSLDMCHRAQKSLDKLSTSAKVISVVQAFSLYLKTT